MRGGNRAKDQTLVALQARAWQLRCKGWTLERIAREVGRDVSNVCRWLEAIEEKELARLSSTVARAKARQNAVLEHLLDESLQAWERSKAPRKRVTIREGAVVKGVDGSELQTPDGKPIRGPSQEGVELIDRDGEPAYLDRAFVALTQIRKLWGLDVEPKPNDEGGPLSYAAIVQRMKVNAQKADTTT